MPCVATLHVLRVFCAADGSHGNPLGVFLDGGDVPPERRQELARELGFSETVFVDDAPSGAVRIFTPALELPFAGHPTVGTAWLLARERAPVDRLRCPAGELHVRADGERTWIAAPPEFAPYFEFVELPSAAEIDALTEAPAGGEWAYCWAWIDRDAGFVRARSFVAGAGIAEDEATGSAALALCGRLGRAITVRQGAGSEIVARPTPGGRVEIGGRVALERVEQRG